MTISARCSGVLNDQNSRPSLPRFDSPAVHLNEAADELQADPQTSLRVSQGSFGLSEHLEDVGQHLGRNANAVHFARIPQKRKKKKRGHPDESGLPSWSYRNLARL